MASVFSQLGGLTAICLPGNRFVSGAVAEPLAALPALVKLDISTCEGVTNNSLAHLSRLTHLSHLDMSFNQVHCYHCHTTSHHCGCLVAGLLQRRCIAGTVPGSTGSPVRPLAPRHASQSRGGVGFGFELGMAGGIASWIQLKAEAGGNFARFSCPERVAAGLDTVMCQTVPSHGRHHPCFQKYNSTRVSPPPPPPFFEVAMYTCASRWGMRA